MSDKDQAACLLLHYKQARFAKQARYAKQLMQILKRKFDD
jgi:hypothetical protein